MSEPAPISKFEIPKFSLAKKCGECIFAQKITGNPKMLDCYGSPPSVHIIGASQDAIGRPQLNVETFVPRVTPDRAACALYQKQLSS